MMESDQDTIVHASIAIIFDKKKVIIRWGWNSAKDWRIERCRPCQATIYVCAETVRDLGF